MVFDTRLKAGALALFALSLTACSSKKESRQPYPETIVSALSLHALDNKGGAVYWGAKDQSGSSSSVTLGIDELAKMREIDRSFGISERELFATYADVDPLSADWLHRAIVGAVQRNESAPKIVSRMKKILGSELDRERTFVDLLSKRSEPIASWIVKRYTAQKDIYPWVTPHEGLVFLGNDLSSPTGSARELRENSDGRVDWTIDHYDSLRKGTKIFASKYRESEKVFTKLDTCRTLLLVKSVDILVDKLSSPICKTLPTASQLFLMVDEISFYSSRASTVADQTRLNRSIDYSVGCLAAGLLSFEDSMTLLRAMTVCTDPRFMDAARWPNRALDIISESPGERQTMFNDLYLTPLRRLEEATVNNPRLSRDIPRILSNLRRAIMPRDFWPQNTEVRAASSYDYVDWSGLEVVLGQAESTAFNSILESIDREYRLPEKRAALKSQSNSVPAIPESLYELSTAPLEYKMLPDDWIGDDDRVLFVVGKDYRAEEPAEFLRIIDSYRNKLSRYMRTDGEALTNGFLQTLFAPSEHDLTGTIASISAQAELSQRSTPNLFIFLVGMGFTGERMNSLSAADRYDGNVIMGDGSIVHEYALKQALQRYGNPFSKISVLVISDGGAAWEGGHRKR